MTAYQTGYGNPPDHTKFRKGESGNKKGRPKKSDNHRNILRRELEAKVTISENGKSAKITKWEMIVKQQVNKAAKGDLKAAEWVAKHADRFGLFEPAEVLRDASEHDEEILNAFVGILDDSSIECVSKGDVAQE